jgi:hypothetical protein
VLSLDHLPPIHLAGRHRSPSPAGAGHGELDLFVERVARRYGLAAHFDTVVVSCTEGTDDKTTLCELALDRLGLGGGRSEALLIDNRRDLAEAWQRSGGAAYVYRGDEAFEADLPTLLG